MTQYNRKSGQQWNLPNQPKDSSQVGRGQCYAFTICTEMIDDKVADELTNQNQSISERPLFFRPLLLPASRHNQKN